MSPGSNVLPSSSTTSAPAGAGPAPTPTIWPRRTTTVAPSLGGPPVPSTRRAPTRASSSAATLGDPAGVDWQCVAGDEMRPVGREPEDPFCDLGKIGLP